MNTLDEIIREQPDRKSKSDPDTQLIIYDPKEGEILESMSIIPWKKLRFFEVNKEKVAFNIGGPELAFQYNDSKNPFRITISYDARVDSKAVYKLVRFVSRYRSPIDAINNLIKEGVGAYVFKNEDFVTEFSKHKIQVIRLVAEMGKKYGLELKPYVSPAILGDGDMQEFVDCQHTVMAKTSDAQTVEISHTLMLTLTDRIKYSLSGVKDIKIWIKNKLDQYTGNAIIEISYADVLVNLDSSIIKDPIEKECATIGYKLKQLVSVPGQDNEKFYFETADNSPTSQSDFTTKDQQFKVSVNIIVNGRLDLHHTLTKKYIKPGDDIIASMKKNVIEYAKLYLNTKTPDECFLQLFQMEQNLYEHIRQKLVANYGFKDLDIIVKFMEGHLAKRFGLLQEKPWEVQIEGEFGERVYSLWYRVIAIDPKGWFRFRVNNYSTTEEEVNDIGRMIKNGMYNLFSDTSGVNGENIVNEFRKVQKRIIDEFGLQVRIHDFHPGRSLEELKLLEVSAAGIEEKKKQLINIKAAETEEVNFLLKKRKLIIDVEEDEEEIKKIDKRIAAIAEKDPLSKNKLLAQRGNNDFLLPPSSEENDDPVKDQNK